MGRVNVHVSAGNSSGQSRSMGGGRGSVSSAWAVANTDNTSHQDCAVQVDARVEGQEYHLSRYLRKICRNCGHKYVSRKIRECPQCGTLRQGTDTRVSIFTISLSQQNDKYCRTNLTIEKHALVHWEQVPRQYAESLVDDLREYTDTQAEFMELMEGHLEGALAHIPDVQFFYDDRLTLKQLLLDHILLHTLRLYHHEQIPTGG